VLDLRIRKAVAHKGALLFSVGDHLAGATLGARRFATFAEAAAAIPPAAERIALVWDGADAAEGAAVDAWSASGLAAGKTLRTYIVGEQANGRGAESVGMLPRVGGLDTGAMLRAARDGKLGALALFGVNPVLHWPDRELAVAALRATPFVVVSELFLTETAELATLVLPACAAFEKSGTTTDLAGNIRPVVAGVPAPDAVLADGDMLVALADVLGIALPLPAEIERRIRELGAATPELPELGSAVPAGAGEGLRVIVEASSFSGGGTVAHDARLAELRTVPRATFHPTTAATLGLRAGDAVDLGAGERTLRDLTVAVDPCVPPGAVALVAGLPAANVNALGSGAVTVAAHRPAQKLVEA
jgi:anaerobic selenocysteine-containing dehydrogenase